MSKYITIAELYEIFDKQGKNFRFSQKDTSKQILIATTELLTFENSENDEDVLKVHLQACHTGINDNKCNVDTEVMTKSLPTLINKPILGYIYEDEDGEYQFHAHDEGEQIVGFLPESCNPQIVYDEEKKKDYVEVDGIIIEKYTKAADILRREEQCAVSVEMAVNEMEYDAKNRILNIIDFVFQGVTILGKNADGTKVREGMAGSNIKIKDAEVSFDEQQAKLEELSRQIAEIQNSLAINNSEKGGKEGLMKFDELLAKYNKTAEDITFETEGLSDEELEEAFTKAFADEATEETVVMEESIVEESESVAEPEAEEAEDATPAEDSEPEATEDAEPSASEDSGDVGAFAASLKVGEKEFSLNLDEKYAAISNLVNMTYGGEDDWFSVTFFDEDGYVIMQSWCTGNAYKQSVERTDDSYQLVGERVEVQSMWVTADEKAQVESMRNSYNDILSKLQNYENEPAKMEVLNSNDYAGIRESEEFSKLMDVEAHFEMSVDEVKEKADSILLNAAKNNSLNFASQNVQTTRKAIQFKSSKGSGRYGNMFSK